VTPRDEQTPDYFGVLVPLAAFALLIWWMMQ
jgi:hypothetical protein